MTASTILAIAGLLATVVIAARGLVRALRRADDECHEALHEPDTARVTGPGPLLNVDIPAPTPRLWLACPHCGYERHIEDLSLVGETVECPACEMLFLVLEPAPGLRVCE